MKPVYEFLGMRVGVISAGQSKAAKQEAYQADIVFGTNNEFGFDYLRDNLEYHKAGQVQRRLAFAIVDEVDSILIDEARTPLIISGPSEESTEMYERINRLIPRLKLRGGDDSAARNNEIGATKVSVIDRERQGTRHDAACRGHCRGGCRRL